MAQPAPARIASLDLVRGVAVLGIVVINVTGFAGPPSWTYAPNGAGPRSPADLAAFMAGFVLFEGKMRALFSILFGAGLLLFVERTHSARTQARRLLWLALFGYLHFLLLWDGDILFVYAVAGLAALILRRADPAPMVASALLLFTAWQINGTARWAPAALAEQMVLAGTAAPSTRKGHAAELDRRRLHDARALAELRQDWAGQAGARLAGRPFYPATLAVTVMGETLCYVLIGMALARTGFFSGGWSRRGLARLAALGLGLGGGATLVLAVALARQGWPEMTMHLLINHALGYPHLLMALGYAALLVLAAPHLAATGLGQRLIAAGRMAFSNYIATSVVMAGLFHGWGLGLAGRVPQAGLTLAVAGMWLLMLAWSRPWLARFRQGPLEWAWRSLTEGRPLPLRRITPPG